MPDGPRRDPFGAQPLRVFVSASHRYRKERGMRAGIGVDNWKLPVFRKRLKGAGYEYEDGGSLTHDTTLLTVETNNMFALKKVLEKCQAECRKGVDT